MFEYHRQEAKHIAKVMIEAQDDQVHRLHIVFRPGDELNEAYFNYASKEEAWHAGRHVVTWLRKGKELCSAELLSWLKTDEGRKFYVSAAISLTMVLPGLDEEDAAEDRSEPGADALTRVDGKGHPAAGKLKDRMQAAKKPVTKVQDSFAIPDTEDSDTQDVGDTSIVAGKGRLAGGVGADSKGKSAVSQDVATTSTKGKMAILQSTKKTKHTSSDKKFTPSMKSSEKVAVRPLKSIKKATKASKSTLR